MSENLILECRDCGAKFRVKLEDLGPEGRFVHCSNCGYEWMASAEEAVTGTEDTACDSSENHLQEKVGQASEETLQNLNTLRLLYKKEEAYPEEQVESTKNFACKNLAEIIVHAITLTLLITLTGFALILSRPQVSALIPSAQAVYELLGFYDYSNIQLDLSIKNTDVLDDLTKALEIHVKNTSEFTALPLGAMHLTFLGKNLQVLDTAYLMLYGNIEPKSSYTLTRSLYDIMPRGTEYISCEMGNKVEFMFQDFASSISTDSIKKVNIKI